MKVSIFAIALIASSTAAFGQSSSDNTTAAGQYKPGTLGNGTADNAGQAMQGSINRADAVGDGITPPSKVESGDKTTPPPKEPKPVKEPKEAKEPKPVKEPAEPKPAKEPREHPGHDG